MGMAKLMDMTKSVNELKTHIDYISARSLRLLMDTINQYNEDNLNTPILKDDIVEVKETGEGYILLYYK